MGTIHCLALLLPVAFGLGSTYADPGIGTLYGTAGFSPVSDLTKLP